MLGDIWIVWDTRKIEVLQSWVNSFSISVRRRRRGSDDEWLASGVCEMGPWGVCGEFNEILNVDDRTGDGRLSPGAVLFADFVNNQGLRDMAISGAFYTWSNM